MRPSLLLVLAFFSAPIDHAQAANDHRIGCARSFCKGDERTDVWGMQQVAQALKIPLILDEAVNIDEEGLLTHEFDELLHERPQSRLRHSWHQLVVQAALPEQRVDAPFGGACFEMFVEAQSFASGAKQRQKRNCQCIEKP